MYDKTVRGDPINGVRIEQDLTFQSTVLSTRCFGQQQEEHCQKARSLIAPHSLAPVEKGQRQSDASFVLLLRGSHPLWLWLSARTD